MSNCNQIFCHTFEDIFHANFDAHLKKQLECNNLMNFGQSNLSMIFKTKIKFGDAPITGKHYN